MAITTTITITPITTTITDTSTTRASTTLPDIMRQDVTTTIMAHDHHGHEEHAPLKAYHDEDMQSVAIRHEGEVDPARFVPWLNELTQRDGPDILRCKGIIAFKDEPRRFVFQGVHMILDGDLQRDWREDEQRSSRLVFIGRKLKEAEIREGFAKTVA